MRDSLRPDRTVTPPRVLMVDDNPRNLQVLGAILKREGYELIVAADGRQALNAVRRTRPDLILMDVMMPVMDGFEACRRIKCEAEGREIPLIFLTARNETDDLLQGFEAGAVDYVTKPFNQAELLARVRTHIDLRRSRMALETAYAELAAAHRQLELAARTDPLTGLFNRREMMERITAEVGRFQRNGAVFSLAIADIDEFKPFNDRYGHACGDRVLCAVADRMPDRIRRQDVVGRWGGEEFLVLLPDTALEGAAAAAENLRQAVRSTGCRWAGEELSVTVTIGVSEFQADMDADACLRVADNRLYAGKAAGKNRVVGVEE
ncbi:MAG: diguanylate cyclase [Thermodesulfobacteriota bacterium]